MKIYLPHVAAQSDILCWRTEIDAHQQPGHPATSYTTRISEQAIKTSLNVGYWMACTQNHERRLGNQLGDSLGEMRILLRRLSALGWPSLA